MRIICFKIFEDELDALDTLARKLNLTRSEVIRRAIREYVRKHGEEIKHETIRVKRVVLT